MANYGADGYFGDSPAQQADRDAACAAASAREQARESADEARRIAYERGLSTRDDPPYVHTFGAGRGRSTGSLGALVVLIGLILCWSAIEFGRGGRTIPDPPNYDETVGNGGAVQTAVEPKSSTDDSPTNQNVGFGNPKNDTSSDTRGNGVDVVAISAMYLEVCRAARLASEAALAEARARIAEEKSTEKRNAEALAREIALSAAEDRRIVTKRPSVLDPDAKTKFRKAFLAAENGDVKAMIEVAQRYDTGDGVAENPKEAAKYFRRASKNGNRDGTHFYAKMHLLGRGVDRDLEEAVRLFEQAAEAGSVVAMYDLGLCYRNGEGVARNLKTAEIWLRKADVNLHPFARLQLDSIHLKAEQ